MKRTSSILLTCISSHLAFSQVGINTTKPKTTLEIVAQNTTGNFHEAEGVLIARFSRERVQSMTNVPISTLVFVDDISTGSQIGTAINIDAIGFYYFNGTEWVQFSTTDKNVYNTNGILHGNRTVEHGNNTLAFKGSIVNSFSIDDDTFSVDAENHRIGIGTNTPLSMLDVIGNNITSPIRLRNIETSDSSVLAEKKTLAPLLIDNNGIVVRQFSPVVLPNSYHLEGEFLTEANGNKRTVFTEVEFTSMVLFKFLSDFSFGLNDSAFLFSQISFSGKHGFQVGGDWSYTGTAISPKVNVIGVGSDVLIFDFNVGSDLVFMYDIISKSIKVYKTIPSSGISSDSKIYIYEGKKIGL